MNSLRFKWRLMRSRPQSSHRASFHLQDFLTDGNAHSPVLDVSLQFCFFSHNKVAQTSINRHLLRERAVVRKDSEKRWKRVFERQVRLWERGQPFIFTIVRNPYSRVFSAFKYLVKIGVISQGTNFDQFVVETLSVTGTDFDPHFCPQEKFSKPIRDLGFDRVILFEELEEGWREMAPSISAPADLPHANKTDNRALDLSQLSTETLDVIETLYAKDFDGLGYERYDRAGA